MFVSSPALLESRMGTALKRTITEMGVAVNAPNRREALCSGLSGSSVEVLVYWDGEGAGGNYKLDKETAIVNCAVFTLAIEK